MVILEVFARGKRVKNMMYFTAKHLIKRNFG